MTHDINSQLGLINPLQLKPGETILHKFNYEMFPEKDCSILVKNEHLVILIKFYSKLTKEWRFSQSEFPLHSVPWIIDRIENGFWKKPDEGGLSNFERSVHMNFKGETIGINAMMHCCEENLPGYNIWNKNRIDYIDDSPPQDWNIPTYMLKDGLLDELKKIATEYC